MDYLITAVFVVISFTVIYKVKMYGARGISKHWFAGSFALKLLAAGVMVVIYQKSERNKADIFRFYDDAKVLTEVATTEPVNYIKMITGIDGANPDLVKYYEQTNNWDYSEGSQLVSNNRFIIRYLSVISLLTFGSYGGVLVITIFFAFTGLFWVFRFFYSRIPKKKWIIFFVVFFTPSLVFWTSGLLKESLLVSFIGLSLNCGGFALKGRQSVFRLIIFSIALFFIFQLRAITAVLWILMILPFIWNHFRPKQRAFISYFIFFFIAISFASESDKIMTNGVYEIIIQKKEAFTQMALESQSGSFISAAKLEPNTLSFIKNAPSALMTVLFRPFPWEAKGIMMWVATFENILLLIAIIFTLIFFNRKMSNYNLLWFSIIFAIFYMVIIGLSVPVLGAVSRYRVIPLLFFELGLIQVLDIDHIKQRLKLS